MGVLLNRFFALILGIVVSGSFVSCKLDDDQARGSISGSNPPVDSAPPSGDPPPPESSYVCEGGPTTFTTNMNARLVLGQADFTTSAVNGGGSAGASVMSSPLGVWGVDGAVFVGDAGNNRVLIFSSPPTTNGEAADVVVGQPDFISTTGGTSGTELAGVQGVSVDDTYLIVSEWTNNRVSFWPLSDLSSISYVLGQNSVLVGSGNQGGAAAANTIANATHTLKVGTKYIVTDAGNNRVLIFDANSLANDLSAEVVVGQPDMTTTTSGSTNDKLSFPLSAASDGTKLAILDKNNNRVLIYNSIPTSNGATADVVLGGWGTADNQLANPVGVFMGHGKLFVVDRGNDRVLVYNSIPTVNGASADAIIGQAGAGIGDHNQCNCSTPGPNTLWGPHMAYYDGCRLYVADLQNNRVLIY